MSAKSRLVESIKDYVLERIEVPISIHNFGDEVDLENEIADLLMTYDWKKQQVLDMTELIFDEYVNHIVVESVSLKNDFGSVYSDFIRYYVASYITKYLLEKVTTT